VLAVPLLVGVAGRSFGQSLPPPSPVVPVPARPDAGPPPPPPPPVVSQPAPTPPPPAPAPALPPPAPATPTSELPPPQPTPALAPTPPTPKPTAKPAKDCPPWVCKDADPFGNDRAAGTARGAGVSKGAMAKDDAKAADPKKPKEAEEKPKRFIEGELANVGAIGLVPWENRFGIVAGVEQIGDTFFAAVTPQINWSRDVLDLPFSMSFGAPFRMELYDRRPYNNKTGVDSAGGGFKHIGRFRSQDWNSPGDFAQLIRGIQWGGKEGHFYLDVNAFKASSIGHGALLKRYNPNLNLNIRRVSAQFDAFGDYGGGETFVNDVTGPNVVGALAFLKPLSFIDRESYLMRSFSIGATFAADLKAPLRNHLDYLDADKDGLRELELEVDQKTFQPKYTTTQVFGYGIDSEIKLVDTKTTDWKTYVDYSMLASGLPVNPNDPAWEREDADKGTVQTGKFPATKGVQSGGFTWGNLLRLNLGDETVHALRIRGELRRYDANFLPTYFDAMYEAQRVLYGRGVAGQPNVNDTKLQAVLGRDAKKIGTVFGMYGEFSWLVQDIMALAFAIELNNETPDNNFFMHFELPRWQRFQFLATYHRRSVAKVADLFSFDEKTGRNILILKGRYRVADILHLNLEAITPYGSNPENFFESTVDFNLNAEIGFSYGAKKAKEASQ
jgi:hypothetical protein